jgi:chromosome segregation ATPase
MEKEVLGARLAEKQVGVVNSAAADDEMQELNAKISELTAAAAAAEKEKKELNMKISELTAAAAAFDKEKKELNLKISELNASLKTAAAKEAKMVSSRMNSSADEEKNKTIAQQTVKITQLEGALCSTPFQQLFFTVVAKNFRRNVAANGCKFQSG